MSPIAKTVLAATIFAAAMAPIEASAVNAASIANMKGFYSFRFSGTDYVISGKQIVATGVYFADGAGNISGKGSITYNDGGAICTGTTINSTYTVAGDGEGVLILKYSLSGTCPLGPQFTFAIALANPASGIFKTVQMSSTAIVVNGDTNSPNIPVVGVAEFE
jgi:hypothetical protein